MDFHETFPECYLLNLARRGDRRARCEFLFETFGLRVRRFPAVDSLHVRNLRGFEGAGRYAHAISTRMIIRDAKRRGAPAVFIFEDDVVFHPQFHELLEGIELPGDWGMFYLGGQHHVPPEVVGSGLVRVKGALDTHAWGVRAEHYDLVLRALAGKVHPPARELPPADVLLAKLQSVVPTYGVFPNLAWQMEDFSDLAGGDYSNYRADGSQVPAAFMLRGVHAECAGAKPWAGLKHIRSQEPFYERWYKSLPTLREEAAARKASARSLDTNLPPQPLQSGGKIAFLFVTVGQHRHPKIWEDYWRDAEGSVSVHAHTTGREKLEAGWLRDAQMDVEFATKWAHVTTLKVQIELLKLALEDERNQFFAFLSESCLPVRPLAELRRLVALDGRSRFGFTTYEDVSHSHPKKAGRALGNYQLPATLWRFQSQWVFLNRELAQLVCDDNFLAHFEEVFAPDETYFGTVANLKGYPLEGRVANKDMTWTEWERHGIQSPKTYAAARGNLQSELLASGCFFARKFDAACDLSAFRLHLPTGEVGERRGLYRKLGPGCGGEVIKANGRSLDGSEPPGLRRPPRPAHQRDESYEAKFDFHALWCDAFFDPAGRGLCVVAPPLLNLADWFRQGKFVGPDGNLLSWERNERSNCEIWEIGAKDAEVRFVDPGGKNWPLEVGANHCDRFEGRRVVMAMVKNDRLEWISDWLKFHVGRHGLDAVLLYNNGSTDYGSEELLETMATVPGIEVAVVVPWNFPYGPSGGDGIPWDSNFGQSSAFEDGHHRYLSKARGVLVCDVDELVVHSSGCSVFDLCEASPHGYLQFPGRWCYCVKKPDEPWPGDLRHRHHRHNVPEWGASCPTKWVIEPRRINRHHQWSVHQLFDAEHLRASVLGLEFRHFRGINTGWKHDRSDQWGFDPKVHEEDRALARDFAALGWA